MIKDSIVIKLWLATSLLVLLTLGLATVTQVWLLKNTYYRQQVKTILDGTTEVANSVGQDNTPEVITDRLEGLANGLRARVFLVNESGQIIYASSEGTGWPRGMMHGMGGPGYGFGARSMFGQVDMEQILAGKSVITQGHHPMFDMDMITVAVPVRQNKKVVGAVLVSAALQSIDANLRALQGVSVYSLLGGLLLATGLSWLLSRSISRPLLKMNKVARAMAQGDYTNRIDMTRHDEIGMLAQSLNTLSKELNDKINLLRQIDETRRDFVASVSHELRTPLTIIQGYTEALLDEVVETPEKKEEYLHSILEETLRLRRLVNDLLDLRQIETGQVKLNKQAVDLADLFSAVLQKMEGLFREKQVDLKLALPEKPVVAEVDPDRIGQVLINLVDNALRATPGGGRILVKLMVSDNEITVKVTDSGPGIPKEEQKLIWHKFYKIDKSRSRSGGGTGLGLAIVKQLVEIHGGRITLDSQPGQGTTFSFTLPMQPGAAPKYHQE
ncbi:integral membrane sensor signal transduction histidine kinase [Desulfotomaculum nigrificans CO-1-SRB]|uniref:histidine kinase n=1 Tax=Desulfotomaculum nigrificans (strain DSM 14880 / VKM B-2319 / CO-1-SRB) TaxID=868595 RepID=F6B5X0_DESCC|nr:ATP-binding protein [Desulfotomaculum nigrificans]AEF94289.1 integral membrane sensor signal transduction histidine kinase [Desulfotomaculum nigrificans CO-1-SRB]